MTQHLATIQQAIAHAQAGRGEEAKAALRRALTRSPNDARVAGAMAHVHAMLGETDQAALFAERAAKLEPNDIRPQWQAGDFLLNLRRFRQAVPYFERCLKLNPAELAAAEGLGRCRMSLGDDAGMKAAYEHAIASVPDKPQPYWLYMRALQKLGRIDEAIGVIRRGLERLPGDKDLTEFLCTLAQFSDAFAGAEAQPEVLAMHRALGEANSSPAAVAGSRLEVEIDFDPERPLRVGLLSGDFCFHACAFFLVPLVRNLDPAQFSVTMFGANPPDETTSNFARMGVYHDCSRLSDDDLGSLVRRERIDVLIDCNGWTDRHRLPAMARRLAPVQATYLGYPNTTGLAAMDWRIVDAITDAPEADAWASERLLRLDGCFVCFSPSAAAPAPKPRSVRSDAGVVFGSFNRLAKISDTTLRLWARVLSATPGSRLALKSETYEMSRSDTLSRFAAAGGDGSRLVFLPFEPDPARHLAAYDGIDIALDSFPYNGTTTTCEALSMGVPVVTLAGAAHRSRVGASLLNAAGLGDLVARDGDEYVRLASELAGNGPRLGELHASLPERTRLSALCDGRGFGARFGAGLRQMWRERCARKADA
ncbi:MAG: tetratricopeptide repeat protein [Tepidisphaera sp.]|nr:tetratricopeptide repeat protein [Tepidisphaera sp.]